MLFRHLLTQLKCQIQDLDGAFGGVKLEALKIIETPTKAVLNLETGVLAQWTNTGEITLPIQQPVEISSSAPVKLQGELMLQPGQTEFYADIKTSAGTFPRVQIVPVAGGEFGAGRSYLVMINFRNKKPVELKADVTPWETGATGEGDVSTK